MTSLNLIFAGTPAFAVPALEALLAAGHRVCAVYTQPDRPAGRGQHVQFSAVKECALRHHLLVRQPQTLRDPNTIAELVALQADAMIVVAYGLILPKLVLQAPRLGCINIHGSLLPRWRGAAPIQRAILAGDRETGISIMRMEEGLDTGPVIHEVVTAIQPRETAADLHDRLSILGAQTLVDALPRFAAGAITPLPQATNGVTYATKLTKAEARIDWSHSALSIDAAIRAFNPWPVAETRWQDKQLRIWEAEPLLQTTSAVPGTVLNTSNKGIAVATGPGTEGPSSNSGALLLTRVQLAGRAAQPASEFIHAHRLDGVILQ
jgi:methionyl-tRNA formyltransferase